MFQEEDTCVVLCSDELYLHMKPISCRMAVTKSVTTLAGADLSKLTPGSILRLPPASDAAASGCSLAAIAATDARRSKHRPNKGIVAVKVQYPDAYPTMALDLGNVKAAAQFLQRTEMKFDLTSAVVELAKQIKLEFDFGREARIMDDISTQLQVKHHWTNLFCQCHTDYSI